MKHINKLGLGLLSAVAFGAMMSSCEDEDMYSVDAPDWVSSKIDSITLANKVDPNADTVAIDLMIQEVGAKDCSAAWWTEFSQSFEIAPNKKLTVEFDNFSSGANNWNNWNLAVTTSGDRDDKDNYHEYFVIRSDAYGWGGDLTEEKYKYDAALIRNEYPLNAEGGIDWAAFLTNMQGAHVTMEIDHSVSGNVFVTATAVAKDGTKMIQTFQNGVSSSDPIYAFLVVDGSHLKLQKAFITKSEITVIEDVMPTSIAFEGVPEVLELGDTNFLGNGGIKVTYADGTSALADTALVNFNLPDLTTLGEKVIVASYNTSKQGELCASVSAYFTINVVTPVKSIAVTKAPALTKYYFANDVISPLNIAGIEVTADHGEGQSSIIDPSRLKFSELAPKAGKQTITVSYDGAKGAVTATFDVEVIAGKSAFGAIDFTNAWWSTFSEDQKYEAGKDVVFDMALYSDNLENFHSPCVILRKADMSEYCVVRMDHFGWGAGVYDGNDSKVVESDWNWDVFASSLNGSDVKVTVSVADGNATIRYDVTYANGEQHFQQYAGLPVDAADLQVAIVTEESYIVLK